MRVLDTIATSVSMQLNHFIHLIHKKAKHEGVLYPCGPMWVSANTSHGYHKKVNYGGLRYLCDREYVGIAAHLKTTRKEYMKV